VLSALIRRDPPMCAGDCPKTVPNGGSLEAAMAQLAGIQVRHRTTCATRSGGKCNCKPGYQANVWSAREGKRLKKTFPTLAAARAWRAEAQTGIRRGTLRAPVATTVREAGDVTLPVSAAAGTILHFICGLHPWMQGKIVVT
jgi:hypothetical protein